MLEPDPYDLCCITPGCKTKCDSSDTHMVCTNADEDQEEGEESDEEDAEVQQAAEAMVAGEVAPACLDVTLALRYMTHDSRITFHQVSHEHQLGLASLGRGHHRHC